MKLVHTGYLYSRQRLPPSLLLLSHFYSSHTSHYILHVVNCILLCISAWISQVNVPRVWWQMAAWSKLNKTTCALHSLTALMDDTKAYIVAMGKYLCFQITQLWGFCTGPKGEPYVHIWKKGCPAVRSETSETCLDGMMHALTFLWRGVLWRGVTLHPQIGLTWKTGLWLQCKRDERLRSHNDNVAES